MLIFNKHVKESSKPDYSVSLPFEKRVRGRLRVTLDDDQGDAGIDIERGDVLAHGALLANEEGSVLVVFSQPESVSVASTADSRLFSRACYHVGNRHAQVQIADHELIYLHDHVLDEMLKGLGLQVVLEERAFDPESGAYASNSSSHHHHHEHHHAHSNEPAHNNPSDI